MMWFVVRCNVTLCLNMGYYNSTDYAVNYVGVLKSAQPCLTSFVPLYIHYYWSCDIKQLVVAMQPAPYDGWPKVSLFDSTWFVDDLARNDFQGNNVVE